MSSSAPKSKRSKCPDGTRKNKKTGNCEGKSTNERKNCPKGTRRNKKTGNCEKMDTKEAKTVDDVCSICLGVIEDDKYKTKCAHTFHSKCLGAWCASRSVSNKTCPYCRENIAGDCKNIEPLSSANVFPYLYKTFTYPLPSAYYYRDVKKADEDNDRVIQRFLDDPTFNPNTQLGTDGLSMTPLMAALKTKKCKVAEQLMKIPSIDINLRDNEDRSALYYSVVKRGCDAVTELLLKRPDLNDRDLASALQNALTAGNDNAIALFRKYKKVPKSMKGLV